MTTAAAQLLAITAVQARRPATRERAKDQAEIDWEMAQEQRAEAAADWRASRPLGSREWAAREEGDL